MFIVCDKRSSFWSDAAQNTWRLTRAYDICSYIWQVFADDVKNIVLKLCRKREMCFLQMHISDKKSRLWSNAHCTASDKCLFFLSLNRPRFSRWRHIFGNTFSKDVIKSYQRLGRFVIVYWKLWNKSQGCPKLFTLDKRIFFALGLDLLVIPTREPILA